MSQRILVGRDCSKPCGQRSVIPSQDVETTSEVNEGSSIVALQELKYCEQETQYYCQVGRSFTVVGYAFPETLQSVIILQVGEVMTSICLLIVQRKEVIDRQSFPDRAKSNDSRPYSLVTVAGL